MKIIFYFFAIIIFSACSPNKNANTNLIVWDEIGEMNSDAALMQGIPASDETTIKYKRNGITLFDINLDKPVVIDSADKEEKWGYFQFPSIGRTLDNKLVAEWNMKDDEASAYGMGGHSLAKSLDGGKTWESYQSQEDPLYGMELKNGDLIKITTPKALHVSDIKLPKIIDSSEENYGSHLNYYRLHDLPENLQGVYLLRLPKGEKKWIPEHAQLIDPLAARYTIDSLFPVVWWGDMQIANDGSLIAGIYPGFLIGEDGKVKPSGVFFYRSTDDGHTWKVQGRIPYEPDLKHDSNGLKRYAWGFTEPAFHILKDGRFICILRTTDGLGNSPMYIATSTDQGKTWSKPITFTKNGVLPRILQLENGVVALASGRPGMELRFSTSKVQQWTDPIEMLPYDINVKGDVSCGYSEMIPTGPDKFLLIYSDYKFKNHKGEIRKAIKVREITVTP